jgi:hypothetical protein
MKSTQLLLFCLLFCAVQASAQVGKGALLLGGTASFQRTQYLGYDPGVGEHATVISITPSVGYMLEDRFAVGINMAHAFVKYSQITGQYTFSALPYARYFLNGGTNARTFLQGTGGLQVASGDPYAVLGGGLGADLFLNDRIAIELLFDYKRIWDPSGVSGFNNIGFNVGIMTFISRK